MLADPDYETASPIDGWGVALGSPASNSGGVSDDPRGGMAEELTRAVRDADRATMSDIRDELRKLNGTLDTLVELIAEWHRDWDDTRVKTH